jgi:AcrR family transcriptional regulator
MISAETKLESRHESKTRILGPALHVFRSEDCSDMRIEVIREAAGLAKGSFFHHFDNKDELALEAVKYWPKGN